MKHTKDAIRYGIETLNITPKNLLSLIESSKDYDGDDYNRWLAAQIIKIAEKDNVGYTLLMAKWFNIIQSMSEEYSDDNIKEEWVQFIKSWLGTGLVGSLGIENTEEFGSQDLSDIDWYKGLDIKWNPDFVDGSLPEEYSDALKTNKPITLLVKFDSKSSFGESSDLSVSAKSAGISCKGAGALILYRMCSIVQALEDGVENFKFVFFTNTDFLYNKENEELLKYFLSFFNYKGYVLNSKELYKGSYTSEEYAICCCTPRKFDSPIQNGFVLPSGKSENGTISFSEESKRYSAGGDIVKSLEVKVCADDLVTVPTINKNMEVVGEILMPKSLGYACALNTDRSFSLYTLPLDGSKILPIMRENLMSFIAYYGVTKSLQSLGMYSNIPDLITGHPEYLNILYNSLPIFLFDIDTKFCDIPRQSGDKVKNSFGIATSKLVDSLLDKGSVYFSFEAKELINICKGFIDFFEERGEDMSCKTFDQIRKEADNASLNDMYIRSLANCKEYVASLYRSTMG